MIIDKTVFEKLKKLKPESHKGQNGRILVIAGSDKFHGALLLTVQTASRIVDMVYVHSVPKNLKLIQKLRSQISTFIAIGKNELWDTVELADSIIIGPGLEESDETTALVHTLLKEYSHKKIVVDATALWHVHPECLHENCMLTPHSREFVNVFKCDPIKENVIKMARKHNCIIVLKGSIDYISNGKEEWENHTGNAGMTKGGSGDVLAGIIGSLAANNDNITAVLAGTYLNGLAGDSLYSQKSSFYNAEDLIEEFGKIWNEYLK